MNNLHRNLAPISASAWEQIEQEAGRTLKRHLSARRVVDVKGPHGFDLSAVGTGHLKEIASLGDGIQINQREVKPLVEVRVPFQLSRQAIDDVDRDAQDSDWSPVKEAAQRIAFAEEKAVYTGFSGANIQGIAQGSSNAALTLPSNIKSYPDVIAKAVSVLRLAGCNGPYAVVLGADAYTAASGGSDDGYPVFHHIERIVDGGVFWAPAIDGAFVLTTRGGDFKLDLGQDISIGYLGHSATTVDLYLQETFTFQMFTSEAAVSIIAPPR